MARVDRPQDPNAAAADEARRAAEEAARRRAEEEARRRAEEAARKAAETAKRAAEEAQRVNSKMEAERKARREVRASVRFDAAAKKLPQRVERQSVKFALQGARTDKVRAQAKVDAEKATPIGEKFIKAVKANDVSKMEAIALPRIEKAAMKGADLVDAVSSAATTVAQAAMQRGLGQTAACAAKVQLTIDETGLKGRAKWGAEGIKEMVPQLTEKIAHLQKWAEQGLQVGDLKATGAGVRKELADVVDTVHILHEANDSLQKLGGAGWNHRAVKEGLDGIESAARTTDAQLTVAEGRARFAEGHAVERVNERRAAGGYPELEANAPPEKWMPAEGEHANPSGLRKSDDPSSEVSRLSSKLEELKARKAAGENVDEQMHSVKANLKNAESVFDSGATSMTGKTAAADGVHAADGAEGAELPPGVTMGPDGVPVDKDGMPLGLSEEDVEKIGTQVPADGGVQVMWSRNDGFPEDKAPGALPSTFAGHARDQGLVTPEQVKTSQDLANKTVPGDEVRKFEAGDVALLAKQAGVPLEKMDPNQLQQAVKLLNAGKTPQEQRDSVAVAVQNLQTIAGGKEPTFTRDEMKNMMWAQSKLPGHALDKCKDSELAAKFKESVAATNAPGEHSFKIGKYNTTIKVADDGNFESSKCKKPSLLSKITKIAKIVAKVGAIIPGPWQPFCLVASAAFAAYDAIKAKSLFGVVTAVASVCGPVGALVSRVAQGVKSVADGIKTWKSGGGFISGLTQVVGGVATALSGKLGKWGERLQNFSKGVGAANGIIQADKAVGKAKEALEKARASGDAAAINDAMKNLEDAERGKKSAILGAGATALTMAAGSANKGKANAEGVRGKADWQVALNAGASAMKIGQGVVNHNYAGALVDGLSLASDLKQGTKAPQYENKLDKNGKPVLDKKGQPIQVERFDALKQGAGVAQGLNGWREAEKAQSTAKKGLADAESALAAAQRSGDPERIKQAEQQVKAARSGLGAAIGGTFSAVAGAHNAVQAAKDAWVNTQAVDKKVAATLQGSIDRSTAMVNGFDDRVAAKSAESKQLALNVSGDIAKAQGELEAANERGDKAAMSAAQKKLERLTDDANRQVLMSTANDSLRAAEGTNRFLSKTIEDGKRPDLVDEKGNPRIDPRTGKPFPDVSLSEMVHDAAFNANNAVSGLKQDLIDAMKSGDSEKVAQLQSQLDHELISQGKNFNAALFKQQTIDDKNVKMKQLDQLETLAAKNGAPPAVVARERERLETQLDQVRIENNKVWTGTDSDSEALKLEHADLEKKAAAGDAEAAAKLETFGQPDAKKTNELFDAYSKQRAQSIDYIDTLARSGQQQDAMADVAGNNPALKAAAAASQKKIDAATANYEKIRDAGGDTTAALKALDDARGAGAKGFGAAVASEQQKANERAAAARQQQVIEADKNSAAGKAESALDTAQKGPVGNGMTNQQVRAVQQQVSGDLDKTNEALKSNKLSALERADLLGQKARLERVRAQATLLDPVIATHAADNARILPEGSLSPAVRNQLLTQENTLKNQYNQANANADADMRAMADLYKKAADDPKASTQDRAIAKAKLDGLQESLTKGNEARSDAMKKELNELATHYGGTMNKGGFGESMADGLGIDVSGMKGSAKSEFETLNAQYKQYNAKGYLTEKERQLIDQQVTNLHLRLGDVDTSRKAAVNWVKDTGTAVGVALVGVATGGAGFLVAGGVGALGGAAVRTGLGALADGRDYQAHDWAQDFAKGAAEGAGNAIGAGKMGGLEKAAERGVEAAAKEGVKDGAKWGVKEAGREMWLGAKELAQRDAMEVGKDVLNAGKQLAMKDVGELAKEGWKVGKEVAPAMLKGAKDGVVGTVTGGMLETAADFETWEHGVGHGLEKVVDQGVSNFTSKEGLKGLATSAGMGAGMAGLGYAGEKFEGGLKDRAQRAGRFPGGEAPPVAGGFKPGETEPQAKPAERSKLPEGADDHLQAAMRGEEGYVRPKDPNAITPGDAFAKDLADARARGDIKSAPAHEIAAGVEHIEELHARADTAAEQAKDLRTRAEISEQFNRPKAEQERYRAEAEKLEGDAHSLRTEANATQKKLAGRMVVPEDGAWFWTKGTKDVAAKMAENAGGTVLENTSLGKAMDKMWGDYREAFGEGAVLDMGGKVSEAYAKLAQGKVNIVTKEFKGETLPARMPDGSVKQVDYVLGRSLEKELGTITKNKRITEVTLHVVDEAGKGLRKLELTRTPDGEGWMPKGTDPAVADGRALRANPEAEARMKALRDARQERLPEHLRDVNGDGITDGARVGEAGSSVPDKVRRLQGLNPEEAMVQERFARAYEADPEGVAKQFREQVLRNTKPGEPPSFETDAAKMLSPDVNPEGVKWDGKRWVTSGDGPGPRAGAVGEGEAMAVKGMYNVATHQTASAITKRAIVQQLDEIAALASKTGEKPRILATAGPVGAGKGYSIEKGPPEVQALKNKVKAIVDCAGEANSSELPWLVSEARKRGIKVDVLYVHNNPEGPWKTPGRGIVDRALKVGRMVDARLVAESNVLGAKNFRAFMDQYGGSNDVGIVVMDNSGGAPRRLKGSEARLTLDKVAGMDIDKLHQNLQRYLQTLDKVPEYVRYSGDVAPRVWGGG